LNKNLSSKFGKNAKNENYLVHRQFLKTKIPTTKDK